MLKETSKSLRLYFGFVAAISFFYAAAVVAQGDLSPLVAVFSVVNLVFGVMFTYIVVKFRVLLYSRPAFIKKVLVANLMFSVVGFALSIPAASWRAAVEYRRHVAGRLPASSTRGSTLSQRASRRE